MIIKGSTECTSLFKLQFECSHIHITNATSIRNYALSSVFNGLLINNYRKCLVEVTAAKSNVNKLPNLRA